MNERLKNQARLLDTDKIEGTEFLVIGAGAIGSFVTMALAKMGAKNIVVYDDDKIEDHNFANQMYPTMYLGKHKSEALADVIYEYSGEHVIANINRWVPGHDATPDIVLCCVDSMDVRKQIWDHFKTKDTTKFFVDGRMGGQLFKVYGVDLLDNKAKELYESTLYPSSEASEELCGQKSIIYTVLGVSCEILSQVKKFLMGEYRPTETINDIFNTVLTTKYTTERQFETVVVEDELVEVP